MLDEEACQREKLEREIAMLQGRLPQTRRKLDTGVSHDDHADVDTRVSQVQRSQLNDIGSDDKSSIANFFSKVGSELWFLGEMVIVVGQQHFTCPIKIMKKSFI